MEQVSPEHKHSERHLTHVSGEVLTCKIERWNRSPLWSPPSIVHFVAIWIITRPWLCLELPADAEAVPG